MKKLFALVIFVVPCLGCGAARSTAIQLDAAFATAVFAASDAAMAACIQKIFSAEQCTVGGSVNRNAQQALIDVKAVTQAIQDAPENAAVPKTLPDLLVALTNLQTLVGDLAPVVPVKHELTAKISAALSQAIAVIRSFTGGT